MFGRNQMLSGRQIKRMVLVDLTARVVLLLPELIFSYADGFSAVLWFLVSLLLAVFIKVMIWNKAKIRTYFVPVYWIYAFTNIVMLFCMFASVEKAFLLPEIREEILILALAVILCFAAENRWEICARIQEILYVVFLVPVFGLLLYAGIVSAKIEMPQMAVVKGSIKNLHTAAAILAVFSEFGFLLNLLSLSKEKEAKRAFWEGFWMLNLGSFLLLCLLQAVFGKKGAASLPFPSIMLMSSPQIQGIFLQRWEVLFAMLLLGSLCGAILLTIRQLQFLEEVTFPDRKGVWKGTFVFFAAAAACVCGKTDEILFFYVGIGCLFLFLKTTESIFVWMEEKRKFKKESGKV